MNRFQSLPDYETFIYNIRQQYPNIISSTLVVVRRGAGYVTVQGELTFRGKVRLLIQERITTENGLRIETYGYEVWQGKSKLYWYDSQPHPDDPSLASTHPHHKHVLPDIKHNRIPAPGLSFSRPNMPFLIEEIEQALLAGSLS